MTGGSSYVLTLPKSWVESLHIQKNDPLGVHVQSDGTLLITRTISDEQVQRMKKLVVDRDTDPGFFLRLLIGTYIAGFTEILITTKERIPGPVRTKIREFSGMVIGPECVEETEQSVLLKALLNPLEMPFENSLKRMFVIVKGMHYDAVEALLTGAHDLAIDVIDRDNDVDRLFWLIARQTNMIMQNTHLSRKMETTIAQMMPYYQVGRIMERVGDHGVRIAHNALKIRPEDVGEDLSAHLQAASTGALRVFERGVEALFTHDPEKANRMIESIHQLEENYALMNQEILSLPTSVAVPVRNMIDSIRRTGEYSADIAENVINYEMMEDYVS